jgi:hypothetical protein
MVEIALKKGNRWVGESVPALGEGKEFDPIRLTWEVDPNPIERNRKG